MKLAEIKKKIISIRYKIIAAAIGALLLAGGALLLYSGYKEYVSLKNDLAVSRRNETAYIARINKDVENMRVLELSAGDLSHSKDSLSVLLEKVRKSLKKPGNKPGDVSGGVSTSIRDTDTIYIANPCDFKLDTVVKYNELTKSSIKIKKDTLFSGIEVNNIQLLYVYSHREFVNDYKSGWHRFWHFDWKKEDVLRFDVKNTNDLIKINDFVIYKIKE